MAFALLGFLLFIIPNFIACHCMSYLDIAAMVISLCLFSVALLLSSGRQPKWMNYYPVLLMILLNLSFGIMFIVISVTKTVVVKSCMTVNILSFTGLTLQFAFYNLLTPAVLKQWISSRTATSNEKRESFPKLDVKVLELPKVTRKARQNFKAMALYAYLPQNTEELALTKGEVVDVFESDGKWWKARKKDGSIGSIPSNYVEIIEEENMTPERTKSF